MLHFLPLGCNFFFSCLMSVIMSGCSCAVGAQSEKVWFHLFSTVYFSSCFSSQCALECAQLQNWFHLPCLDFKLTCVSLDFPTKMGIFAKSCYVQCVPQKEAVWEQSTLGAVSNRVSAPKQQFAAAVDPCVPHDSLLQAPPWTLPSSP